jgi:hypothetical protein
MRLLNGNLRTRLYLIAAFIMIAGCAGAVLVYLTAGNDTDRGFGYETADGYVYQVAPEDTKRYMHDMELYGGKANVLAGEIVNWFGGLWHGKQLALTIAFITVVVSSGFFLFAYHTQPGRKSGVRE